MLEWVRAGHHGVEHCAALRALAQGALAQRSLTQLDKVEHGFEEAAIVESDYRDERNEAIALLTQAAASVFPWRHIPAR